MPPLTHYTRSISAVENILKHGFMWYPNSRRLSTTLLPGYSFGNREPQHFGMISFTELSVAEARKHRESFGEYGIVVASAWATKHRAQRVFYVPDSGPLTGALRDLFLAGAEDLTRKIPQPTDAAWLMSFENRAMAEMVTGAGVWARLLTIWEYLEPEDAASQREWRINSSPDYTPAGTKMEAIAGVSLPENWSKFLRVLPVKPADIEAFICPTRERAAFLSQLPPEFKDHPLIRTDA